MTNEEVISLGCHSVYIDDTGGADNIVVADWLQGQLGVGASTMVSWCWQLSPMNHLGVPHKIAQGFGGGTAENLKLLQTKLLEAAKGKVLKPPLGLDVSAAVFHSRNVIYTPVWLTKLFPAVTTSYHDKGSLTNRGRPSDAYDGYVYDVWAWEKDVKPNADRDRRLEGRRSDFQKAYDKWLAPLTSSKHFFHTKNAAGVDDIFFSNDLVKALGGAEVLRRKDNKNWHVCESKTCCVSYSSNGWRDGYVRLPSMILSDCEETKIWVTDLLLAGEIRLESAKSISLSHRLIDKIRSLPDTAKRTGFDPIPGKHLCGSHCHVEWHKINRSVLKAEAYHSGLESGAEERVKEDRKLAHTWAAETRVDLFSLLLSFIEAETIDSKTTTTEERKTTMAETKIEFPSTFSVAKSAYGVAGVGKLGVEAERKLLKLVKDRLKAVPGWETLPDHPGYDFVILSVMPLVARELALRTPESLSSPSTREWAVWAADCTIQFQAFKNVDDLGDMLMEIADTAVTLLGALGKAASAGAIPGPSGMPEWAKEAQKVKSNNG